MTDTINVLRDAFCVFTLYREATRILIVCSDSSNLTCAKHAMSDAAMTCGASSSSCQSNTLVKIVFNTQILCEKQAKMKAKYLTIKLSCNLATTNEVGGRSLQ